MVASFLANIFAIQILRILKSKYSNGDPNQKRTFRKPYLHNFEGFISPKLKFLPSKLSKLSLSNSK